MGGREGSLSFSRNKHLNLKVCCRPPLPPILCSVCIITPTECLGRDLPKSVSWVDFGFDPWPETLRFEPYLKGSVKALLEWGWWLEVLRLPLGLPALYQNLLTQEIVFSSLLAVDSGASSSVNLV